MLTDTGVPTRCQYSIATLHHHHQLPPLSCFSSASPPNAPANPHTPIARFLLTELSTTPGATTTPSSSSAAATAYALLLPLTDRTARATLRGARRNLELQIETGDEDTAVPDNTRALCDARADSSALIAASPLHTLHLLASPSVVQHSFAEVGWAKVKTWTRTACESFGQTASKILEASAYGSVARNASEMRARVRDPIVLLLSIVTTYEIHPLFAECAARLFALYTFSDSGMHVTQVRGRRYGSLRARAARDEGGLRAAGHVQVRAACAPDYPKYPKYSEYIESCYVDMAISHGEARCDAEDVKMTCEDKFQQ
eukprot:6173752-Pleurochrysis_carterae.AAC.2